MAVPSPSPQVSGRTLQALRLPSGLLAPAPVQFLLRCFVAMASALYCVFWIATSSGASQWVGQFALGLILAHGTELAHQCLHKTGTGHKGLDHALGRLFTLPTGVSFYHYLFFHLWHHKHNGTPQDVESFGYAYEAMSSPSRVSRVWGALRHVSMVDHYQATLHRLALAVPGKLLAHLTTSSSMPESIAARVQADYRLMAGLILAAVVLAVVAGTWLPVTAWLVPVVFAWGPAHALIELPEHFATMRPTADPLLNTRSVRASAFARYYTNGNCDHVEHHAAPQVPMHRLAVVRAAMTHEGRRPAFADQGYGQFFASLARHLWCGPVAASPHIRQS